MLKKNLTYTNLDGQIVSKDFYFNLSNAEVIRWEMEENLVGGIKGRIEEAVGSNDGKKIIGLFQEIIAKAYGERRNDSFVKNAEKSAEFLGSPAYDVLFLELMTNPSYAADFIKQILPSDSELAAQAESIRKSELARQRFQPADHQKKAEKEIPTVIEPPHETEPAPDTTPKGNLEPISDDLLDSLLRSLSIKVIYRVGDEMFPSIETKDGKHFKLSSFEQAQKVVTNLEQYNLRG